MSKHRRVNWGHSNRHPVDELADIREQIRALKYREEELRDLILDGACELAGDDHQAYVTMQTQERIDIPKLKAELGMRALRPFLRSLEIPFVRVRNKQ